MDPLTPLRPHENRRDMLNSGALALFPRAVPYNNYPSQNQEPISAKR